MNAAPTPQSLTENPYLPEEPPGVSDDEFDVVAVAVVSDAQLLVQCGVGQDDHLEASQELVGQIFRVGRHRHVRV